jgi:predicted ATP-grasp superfamily ATP-dependent carboligase
MRGRQEDGIIVVMVGGGIVVIKIAPRIASTAPQIATRTPYKIVTWLLSRMVSKIPRRTIIRILKIRIINSHLLID